VDSLLDKIIFLLKKGISPFHFLASKFFRKKQLSKPLEYRKQMLTQTEMDKRLVLSLSKAKIPSLKQFRFIGRYLTLWERRIVLASLGLAFLSFIFLLGRFYKSHLDVMPVFGGKYTEALIGAPKYINPLYEKNSEVDDDFIKLIFSALFKRGSDMELIPDSVENFTVSADGKIYTMVIKDNIRWHDGEIFTADDIIFTFNAIKDKNYQSTLKQSLAGVEIEKVDDYQIKFVLSQPYAPFLEILTFGILPRHIWESVPPESVLLSDFNLRPIGTGPYKFNSLKKDKDTGRIETYKLVSHQEYYGVTPFIENLVFNFFPSYDEAVAALNDNTVDGIGHMPKEYLDKVASIGALNLYKLNIPQISLIFFNQAKNPALADKKTRQALAYAIDKVRLVDEELFGYARVIDGPILPENFAYNKQIIKYGFNKDEAAKLLAEAGYKFAKITQSELAEISALEEQKRSVEEKRIMALGEGDWLYKEEGTKNKIRNFLMIELSAADREDAQKVAGFIKKSWEIIGVKTIITSHSSKDLQNNVAKNKDYQALLFGQIVGADPDIYAFWHSTQSGENGLNIANFINKDNDILLEEARISTSTESRAQKYGKVQNLITDDEPTIFLYSPYYLYLQGKKIKNFTTKNILISANRFSNINDWYINTGKKIIW
jgi:peptide/nickel transport system substrate-binding protein